MLATVIIIIGGAALCAFIAALENSRRSAWMLGAVISIAVLMIAWIIWYRYFRNTSTGLGFWLSMGRNHRDDGIAAQYRPRKVKNGQSEHNTGTNKPITAEEAHEIQVSSANAWVPSRDRKNNRP